MRIRSLQATVGLTVALSMSVSAQTVQTGALEEVVASHTDVAVCAVIGAADQLKGQLPVGFLVLKAGVERPQEEDVFSFE